MKIREASEKDVPAILSLIQELAVFEKAPDEVINTVDQLCKDLFVERCCSAIVCEMEDTVIGFALYYTSYSTWKGKCMYLEDLYVQEQWRKYGFGQQLFDAVVHIAKSANFKRMDWQVLDWNEPAINFYKKNHATLDSEWINGRLFF